jgi:hypothetical protein
LEIGMGKTLEGLRQRKNRRDCEEEEVESEENARS